MIIVNLTSCAKIYVHKHMLPEILPETAGKGKILNVAVFVQ
jgi:hypothetical protein